MRAMRLRSRTPASPSSDIVHVNARHLDPAGRRRRGDRHPHRARLGVRRRRGEHEVDDGHLLGGAGAVESVAAVLALHHRLARHANLEDPDDEVGLDVVSGEPRRLRDGDIAVLNNSFGFGGHNVALSCSGSV